MFKYSPDVWHKLPTTKKGLMMMRLAKEACEKFKTTDTPPPPKPTVKRTRKKESQGPKGLWLQLRLCRGTGFGIRGLKPGELQTTADSAPELTKPLPPHLSKWLIKENEKWHKELKTDLAMLLQNDDKQTDLVEVFCEPTS